MIFSSENEPSESHIEDITRMSGEIRTRDVLIARQQEALDQYRHRIEELLKELLDLTADEYYWSAAEQRTQITLDKYSDLHSDTIEMKKGKRI